jgi:hypothetical protein
VRHYQVQIMGVPGRNPMVGQFQSFVSRHCRSSSGRLDDTA